MRAERSDHLWERVKVSKDQPWSDQRSGCRRWERRRAKLAEEFLESSPTVSERKGERERERASTGGEAGGCQLALQISGQLFSLPSNLSSEVGSREGAEANVQKRARRRGAGVVGRRQRRWGKGGDVRARSSRIDLHIKGRPQAAFSTRVKRTIQGARLSSRGACSVIERGDRAR